MLTQKVGETLGLTQESASDQPLEITADDWLELTGIWYLRWSPRNQRHLSPPERGVDNLRYTVGFLSANASFEITTAHDSVVSLTCSTEQQNPHDRKQNGAPGAFRCLKT